MLTVACVLKVGITGPSKYLPNHVRRLQEMVSKHLKQPHRFTCLTNLAAVHMPQFNTQPIGQDWPGWWSKIALFQPGRFQGRVLYLDLDVTVIGSLDELADFDAPFVAIQDYQYPLKINSSVMAWDAGAADHLYTAFLPVAKETMAAMHGDQDWIHARIQSARFPKNWCPSFKRDIAPGKRTPEDARVIVYHGRPKPWDLEAA